MNRALGHLCAQKDPTVIELLRNLYVDDWLPGCDVKHIRKANDVMASASIYVLRKMS